MKKYLKKFYSIDVLLVVVLVILVGAMTFLTWQKVAERYAVRQAADEYVSLLNLAKQKAEASEKVNGRVPFSFGVYYNESNRTATVCADLNGDFLCDEGEQIGPVDISISPDWNFTLNYTPSFLSKHYSQGVCFGQDCEVTETTAVANFQSRKKSDIRLFVYVNPKTNQITVE